jgi:tRNA-2-methylthio-N6-dimethylallyladenosine synthase
MGRGYQVSDYLRLVADLRAARPRIALSTDFIVGFPGETEEEFRETLDLVESVRFAALFAFCYSPRPGTPAAKLGGTVPEATAKERLARLLELQDRIQAETHAGLVGREFELLVTGWSRPPGRQAGRTSCNRIVHFETGADPVPPGTMTRIRVSRALPHSLLGERLATPTAATEAHVAAPPPPGPLQSTGRSRLPIVA